MTETTITDIFESIANGAADGHEDEIVKALNARLRSVDTATSGNFQVGDRIVTRNLRPKYLAGLTGTIASKNRTTFNVELDEDTGSRFGQTVNGIKASMMTKVTS